MRPSAPHSMGLCGSCERLCVAFRYRLAPTVDIASEPEAAPRRNTHDNRDPRAHLAGLLVAAMPFSFLLGRCSRRLPIIDNCLPWTVHRGMIWDGPTMITSDGRVAGLPSRGRRVTAQDAGGGRMRPGSEYPRDGKAHHPPPE